MRLPATIVQEISDLPEGAPLSFTVRTDGRRDWKLELHTNVRREDADDLCDLAELLIDNNKKKSHYRV